MRAHLRAVAAALPLLPGEFARASGLLMQDMSERGPLGVLLLVGAFAALGHGSEQVFRTVTAPIRAASAARPAINSAERLRSAGMRLAFGLARVAIFGLGSIGAFLVFDWPPLLRSVVLTYLLAMLVIRPALVPGQVVLAPGGQDAAASERDRLAPVTAESAWFWQARLVFVGNFVLGRATVGLLGLLGIMPPSARRRRQHAGPRPAGDRAGNAVAPTASGCRWRCAGRRAALSNVLLSLCGVALWLLWVAGLGGLFWLAALLLLLPAAIDVARTAIRRLLRPGHREDATRRDVLEVCSSAVPAPS